MQDQADHSAFLESEDRKKRVREKHVELMKDRSGGLRQTAQRYENAVKRNLASIARDKEEKRQELEKSLQEEYEAMEKNASVRQLKLQAETQRKQASRQIVTDIVKENMKRLQKANEYSRYQTLAKVCSNNGRIDELLDRRKQVVLARVNAQREAMIERTKMERAFDAVKDGSSQRVNTVLKSLGMPVGGAEGKEGEEPASPAAAAPARR